MALSLTVFYGTQYKAFLGDYKPSSFADYDRFRALQPGLRCLCGVQTSPFSNFASASVEMNPEFISRCRGADEKSKDDQTNRTVEWILQEFRNTPVSSIELLAQDTLENLANQTFESAIKLGSIITTTAEKTVVAWHEQSEVSGFPWSVESEIQNIATIGLRAGNHLATCTDCTSDEITQMTSLFPNIPQTSWVVDYSDPLHIDKKVVSVNIEVSDPVFDFLR